MKSLNTYALDVLGCKVNQYDARQIARLLEGFGLRPADGEPADLVVVHTCGVTATAVQKSRQTVRRLARKNPGAVVFLTGCAAAEDVTDRLDNIDARVAAGAGWIQMLADELQTFSLPNPDFHLPENSDDLAVEEFGGQTRAFLKIQDGCDAGCAYCIVPQLRKTPRDKSMDSAVAEAAVLTQCGYKEIVIAGVHVGLYGRGSDVSLSDVLAKILKVPDIGRVRMSSLHPAELTEDLLKVWASAPNMMPHLHLSLQSGSDGVLSRMVRGYTAVEYAEAVERARAALDHPAITTDVIVGFPGETDAEFEETFEFCKRIGFAQMHIFSFSPRPGTRAVELPDPVDAQTAQARHQRLAALADEMSLAFNQSFVGQTVHVLVERCGNGVCSGVSEHYVPVKFQGSEDQSGSVVPVVVRSADCRGLVG
ncbi:tRNA (N(6)-L-threonylcarbamoyladenosine(37)-C(2))-methylthiotransferase MtaB [Tichowtungia aerotolerans]|uniref:tRNA (N(6)-L-threonylcarbamoyladenosine(37)-C(2))-methylthiotransferase MtaB n=1 Tax=Tichowtungia aerotolerans TaxID=2697043 RepID=A0A6P1M2X2_9BACT|nr:tRNA (N(6)-L-threonylcarbamoyladenosine(37)-C(2))-methylthiotransferase MtaB [Tichowtungia aerotolerans]QHI68181.1 tRNA (N(6)-L-threonylcarbamoyladenosine(37)-C(2))-methylthiotransferase MtaB [Tichowtungia aerotolerans]